MSKPEIITGDLMNKDEISKLEHRIYVGEFKNKLTYNIGKKNKEMQEKYLAENHRLQEQFLCEAIKACGLENHKNGRKAAEKAWDEMHASGYTEILYRLQEFAELMVG